MAQIQVVTRVTIDDEFGGIEPLPVSTFTQTYTEMYRQTFSLATTAPAVAWNPVSASAAVTAFAVLYARTDATAGVYLELGTDSSGTGAAWNSHLVMKDIPFILGADDSYQDNSTTAAFGNVLGVVDKIRLLNPTASTTVSVKLILLS